MQHTIGPLNIWLMHSASLLNSPVSIENGQYELVELAHSKDAAERDSMVDNPSYYEIKH